MAEALANIEFIKRLVVTAGQRALERCGTVDCDFKADESLVTVVDRETEQFLEAELAREHPGYAFLGEEYGWRGPKDAPLWACDPIDGTTNYVFGLPYWCVSVGLVHEGVPVLGAVYLPALEELFWGVRGQGAFCNGVRLRLQDRESLHAEDTINISSPALKTLDTSALSGSVRNLGSIACEVVCTARGNLCAAIGQGEHLLDVAAALCILFEAGGQFRYLSGPAVDIPAFVEDSHSPYRPDKEHLVYAPPATHRYLQSVLRRR